MSEDFLEVFLNLCMALQSCINCTKKCSLVSVNKETACLFTFAEGILNKEIFSVLKLK